MALCYPPTTAYASRHSCAATSSRCQYSPSTATYSAVTALSHRYVPLRLLHISRRHCYTPSATYAASSSRHSWYSSTAIYARRHHSAAMSFRCRWCASTATISSGKVKLPLHAQCHSLTLLLPADTLSRFASTFSRPHCYAMHAGKVKIPLQQSPIGTCHTPTAVALIRWYILPSLLFHSHCYDHCRKVKLPLQHSHVVTVTLPLLHSHAITARSHHYVPLRLLRHCWNILTS